MAGSQVLIYAFTPVEASMGLVQKIFYTHLPLAWWAFVCFFVVFVASIVYLRTKKPEWDTLAHGAAEVGVILSTLALVSGSIWARHSWGVWWTWDPRLSTTLILWFLYMGYLILHQLDLSFEKRAKISAVLGIIAFVDVPLVFFSARLWRSIHPAVFASKGGGLDADMRFTAIVCVLAWGFLVAALVMIRSKQLDLKRHLQLAESMPE